MLRSRNTLDSRAAADEPHDRKGTGRAMPFIASVATSMIVKQGSTTPAPAAAEILD